jgi:hypothetical protein
VSTRLYQAYPALFPRFFTGLSTPPASASDRKADAAAGMEVIPAFQQACPQVYAQAISFIPGFAPLFQRLFRRLPTKLSTFFGKPVCLHSRNAGKPYLLDTTGLLPSYPQVAPSLSDGFPQACSHLYPQAANIKKRRLTAPS